MNPFNFFQSGSLFGNYPTRKFSDIFPTFESFQAMWNSTSFSKQAVALTQQIPEGGTETTEGPQNLFLIYELLMAEYANSHIKSFDENRFMFQCMSLIFQYAPAWIKRLEIQHTLHELDLNSEEFLRGSTQIFNTSLNPGTGPVNDSLDILKTVNQQNANIQKRDKFKALAILEELLRTNVTAEFIRRFQPLFATVTSPYEALYYTTEITEETPNV